MSEILATTGTEKYLEKIIKSEIAHQKRLSKIKAEILADESLPMLDRAVLGITGSEKILNVHKDLANKAKAHSNEPIIGVKRPGVEQLRGEGGFTSCLLRI
jgi:hypothetical protein